MELYAGGGCTNFNYTLLWNNTGNVTPTSYTWKVNGETKAVGGTSFTLNSSIVGNNTVSCTVTYGSASYTAKKSFWLYSNKLSYGSSDESELCRESFEYDNYVHARVNYKDTGKGTLYFEAYCSNYVNKMAYTEGVFNVYKNGSLIASKTVYNNQPIDFLVSIPVKEGDRVEGNFFPKWPSGSVSDYPLVLHYYDMDHYANSGYGRFYLILEQ